MNNQELELKVKELLNISNFFDMIIAVKEFEKEYKANKEKYETMDDLYKKEQAGILASSLLENTPCPVCGSVVHPSPATIKKGIKLIPISTL